MEIGKIFRPALFGGLRLSSCLVLSLAPASGPACDLELYWWCPGDCSVNFGDHLSKVLVERIVQRPIRSCPFSHPKERALLAIGSIIQHAHDGDVIWGSGFLDAYSQDLKFESLDVRAVRGPLTRELLMAKGIACPEVYGDPALLFPRLFPEFHRDEVAFDYLIIPNISETFLFLPYRNVVYPIEPWDTVLDAILGLVH